MEEACVYWKLAGCFSNLKLRQGLYPPESSIVLMLLQGGSYYMLSFADFGNWNSERPKDKWFLYNEDEEKAVEGYISFSRYI